MKDSVKTVLITSGGTAEPIDRVRKITNMSTGRLGSQIAEALLSNKGIKVIYVHSKGAVMPTEWPKNLTCMVASSTQEVYDTLQSVLTTQKIDVLIHSMAISDYTVDYLTTAGELSTFVHDLVSGSDDALTSLEPLCERLTQDFPDYHKLNNDSKVSSYEEGLIIKLKRTPKIIGKIKEWSPNTALIGFKLLSGVSKDELIRAASELLVKNKCSYVVANDLSAINANGHKAYLVSANGVVDEYATKADIAVGLARIVQGVDIVGDKSGLA